jgi:CRISPR-associated protein Csc1
MFIYELDIRLDEPLYYATREMGRSYQTTEYLHNYALSYALGLVHSEYHDAVQTPRYREHLSQLNDRGVYVTPAKPKKIVFVAHTFKFADTRYHVQMEQSSVNVPTFGKVREVAAESHFSAYVLSKESLRLPSWIRLGKWMSKAEVTAKPQEFQEKQDSFVCKHPLNPLDLPSNPTLFDLINMPPVSIVENAHLEGKFLELDNGLKLPSNLSYKFN